MLTNKAVRVIPVIRDVQQFPIAGPPCRLICQIPSECLLPEVDMICALRPGVFDCQKISVHVIHLRFRQRDHFSYTSPG